jgi:exosortase
MMKAPEPSLAARAWMFVVYCAALSAANVEVLSALYEHSQQDASASHLILIPLISIALILQGRHEFFRSPGWGTLSGTVLIGTGALMRIVSRFELAVLGPQDALTLAVASVVVLAIGGYALFFGMRSLRSAAFPVLFLLFTVPFPEDVLAGAVAVLKAGSADTVAALFTTTGTPYHRDGFVFSLPAVVIEIADECSGIRSSIALLLTSLLSGHMFLQRAWTRIVLLLVVLPITVLKNGVRIVSLCLLTLHVDPTYLAGRLHHEGGVVFFIPSLLLLMMCLALLRRAERSGGSDSSSPDLHTGDPGRTSCLRPGSEDWEERHFVG